MYQTINNKNSSYIKVNYCITPILKSDTNIFQKRNHLVTLLTSSDTIYYNFCIWIVTDAIVTILLVWMYKLHYFPCKAKWCFLLTFRIELGCNLNLLKQISHCRRTFFSYFITVFAVLFIFGSTLLFQPLHEVELVMHLGYFWHFCMHCVNASKDLSSVMFDAQFKMQLLSDII